MNADAFQRLLRETSSRVGRIVEALIDGEYEFALLAAQDLEDDIARAVAEEQWAEC